MFNYTQLDSQALEFVAIAPLAELPPGERLFVEVDGKQIVLFNIAGQVFAIGDVCSHDNGPLGDGELEGHEVICPRHGARFDIRTGQALCMPAFEPVQSYQVVVKDGAIYLAMD